MNIPTHNTIQTNTFSQAKNIGGMNQYEGNDMGGGFYRRMRKENQEKKRDQPEKRSNHVVDLVA